MPTFGIGTKPSCIQWEVCSRLMGGAFENWAKWVSTVQSHELFSAIHAKNICLISPLRDPCIFEYLAFPYQAKQRPQGLHFLDDFSSNFSSLSTLQPNQVGLPRPNQELPSRRKVQKNWKVISGSLRGKVSENTKFKKVVLVHHCTIKIALRWSLQTSKVSLASWWVFMAWMVSFIARPLVNDFGTQNKKISRAQQSVFWCLHIQMINAL